jgi:hypothetical protein
MCGEWCGLVTVTNNVTFQLTAVAFQFLHRSAMPPQFTMAQRSNTLQRCQHVAVARCCAPQIVEDQAGVIGPLASALRARLIRDHRTGTVTANELTHASADALTASEQPVMNTSGPLRFFVVPGAGRMTRWMRSTCATFIVNNSETRHPWVRPNSTNVRNQRSLPATRRTYWLSSRNPLRTLC